MSHNTAIAIYIGILAVVVAVMFGLTYADMLPDWSGR